MRSSPASIEDVVLATAVDVCGDCSADGTAVGDTSAMSSSEARGSLDARVCHLRRDDDDDDDDEAGASAVVAAPGVDTAMSAAGELAADAATAAISICSMGEVIRSDPRDDEARLQLQKKGKCSVDV